MAGGGMVDTNHPSWTARTITVAENRYPHHTARTPLWLETKQGLFIMLSEVDAVSSKPFTEDDAVAKLADDLRTGNLEVSEDWFPVYFQVKDKYMTVNLNSPFNKLAIANHSLVAPQQSGTWDVVGKGNRVIFGLLRELDALRREYALAQQQAALKEKKTV